ncbi:MAG: 30S ribosomal protein S8 [Patescibacteria group bacterium]|jgi:small subunit ribosomal protein S8|nr:30S ribosomal protein S8 [Patescibacteria group bacterium]
MDVISDFLIQIKNAIAVKKPFISTSFSKMKYEIAQILLKEKYVNDVKIVGKIPKKMIKIELKYDDNGVPAIQEIKRISKPGCRRYIKASQLKPVKAGYGRYIISTPRGLMTNVEAKKQKLGGELICEIF